MSPYEIFPESTKSILLAFANPQTACILSGPAHEKSEKSNFFLWRQVKIVGARSEFSHRARATLRRCLSFRFFAQPMCTLARALSGLRVGFFFWFRPQRDFIPVRIFLCGIFWYVGKNTRHNGYQSKTLVETRRLMLLL